MQAWADLNRAVEIGVIAARDRAWYWRALFPRSPFLHALEGLGVRDQLPKQRRGFIDQAHEDTEKRAVILRLKDGQLAG
jgi:hypothetical protein